MRPQTTPQTTNQKRSFHQLGTGSLNGVQEFPDGRGAIRQRILMNLLDCRSLLHLYKYTFVNNVMLPSKKQKRQSHFWPCPDASTNYYLSRLRLSEPLLRSLPHLRSGIYMVYESVRLSPSKRLPPLSSSFPLFIHAYF